MIDDKDDATLATLLKLAGPADPIPGDIEDRVYARVRNEWSQAARRPQLTRRAVPFALAATVLVAVFLNQSGTNVEMHAVGNILGENTEVFIGDAIESKDRGLSIALADDISLRVDRDTVLQVAAADRFRLLQGRVYVDTGDRIYATRHVTIATESGRATDVGTQFAVSYAQGNMSVAVREGRVDLSDRQTTHSASRGQMLTLRPGQGVDVASVQVSGPEWDWAVALAPEFVLAEHSLLDFLKWVARETGMELQFADDSVRAAARAAQPHGSIAGLMPLEAAAAVLATTQFAFSIEGNTIAISR